jgi:hypothetical protein
LFRERHAQEVEKLFNRSRNDGSKYRAGDISDLTNDEKRILEIACRVENSNGVLLESDFPLTLIHNVWLDTVFGHAKCLEKVYVVQTNRKVIERCLLMTTDPGDLVFDPTCGSGTTAFVAEQWGRRWITCDTSRVSLTLARQRLMTAVFDYYELAHPQEGVGSGFRYKTVPHVTLRSIANNPDIKEGMTRAQIDAAIARHAPQETLYDQPFVDRKKTRVSGPFTVEAVPAPAVKSVDELLADVGATGRSPLLLTILASLWKSRWSIRFARASRHGAKLAIRA